MSDILTGTPADLTYAHDLVRQAWMVVWAITSGCSVGLVVPGYSEGFVQAT